MITLIWLKSDLLAKSNGINLIMSKDKLNELGTLDGK